MKVTVYIATSLDGYIARADGDIEWLHSPEYTIENETGETMGYPELMASIDYLVMGRNSFEKVLSFPTWSYPANKVIVLSTTLDEIPEHLKESVSVQSNINNLFAYLKSVDAKHIYIDGGKLIQSFLKAGLVSELIITQIPVLLGSGISLFGDLDKDIHLELLKSISFKNSFVQSHYEIRKTI